MFDFDLDFLPIHMVELNWAPNFDTLDTLYVSDKLVKLDCSVALFTRQMDRCEVLKLHLHQSTFSPNFVKVCLHDPRHHGWHMQIDVNNYHKDIICALGDMISEFRVKLGL